MARCSLLYDVLNLIPVDAQVSGYRISEKALFLKQLDKLQKGDLLLADRGYCYSSILYTLDQRGIDFCIRLHHSTLNLVKEFTKSDESDLEIEYKIPNRALKLMGLPKNTPAIKIRLVKVMLENEEIEVLATSLIDKKKFHIKIFKDLYFQRWGVEEAFKILKSRVGLEAFSGKAARSVYQDFHAKIFMMTMCSALTHSAEQKVRK